MGPDTMETVIGLLDAHYDDDRRSATAAAVLCARWEDAEPAAQYTARVNQVQPYQPGDFFRRELPCLIAVMGMLREPPDVVVIDGYVHLGTRPGLGQHLFDHLHGATSVIGVAKSAFRGADAIEVFRGKSQKPLYITAAGVDVEHAASCIRRMHGAFRIPTLLKQADRLARAS